MTQAKTRQETVDVDRLLAGAAGLIKSVLYCWLVTTTESGGVNTRPMGRLLHDAGEDQWKIRFVTDGRSRKVSHLRRDGRVTLIFQRDADDAWVTLAGRAALRDEAFEVRRRWKGTYDAYFPTEQDRASALFVEIDVERMDLWIRGVTPEPFGLQTTTLERGSGRGWRVAT